MLVVMGQGLCIIIIIILLSGTIPWRETGELGRRSRTGQCRSLMNVRHRMNLTPDGRTQAGRRVMKCKHALSCHVKAIGLEFYN